MIELFCSVVDTPDGFLHEWWVIFYDMFRSRMAANEERDDGSSLSRQHEMNAKLQNPAISADPGTVLLTFFISDSMAAV